MSKSVLLTGSQGFIGSYIAKELLENDYTVVGVDNFSINLISINYVYLILGILHLEILLLYTFPKHHKLI